MGALLSLAAVFVLETRRKAKPRGAGVVVVIGAGEAVGTFVRLRAGAGAEGHVAVERNALAVRPADVIGSLPKMTSRLPRPAMPGVRAGISFDRPKEPACDGSTANHRHATGNVAGRQKTDPSGSRCGTNQWSLWPISQGW